MAAKPETKDIKAEEQKPKVPSPMGWGLGSPSVRTLKTLIPEPTQSQPQLHFLAPTPTLWNRPEPKGNPGTDQNLKPNS